MRFLFVDRILEDLPGSHIRGIKHISWEDPWLYHHPAQGACFIPAFIGETLGQLAAWSVMASKDFRQRPVAGVVALACLHAPAPVGATLQLEAFIDRLDDEAVQYRAEARIDDLPVFTLEGAIGPLLPMNTFIASSTVQRQYQDIFRPDPAYQLPARHEDAQLLPPACLPAFPVLQFDTLLHSQPGVSLTAEKNITRAAGYFDDHFPRNPVLPMTVLLACLSNLAETFVRIAGFSTHYRVSELRKIKMNTFVRPGDRVICQVHIKHHDASALILHFRNEVDGNRVCVVDIVLMPQGDRHD